MHLSNTIRPMTLSSSKTKLFCILLVVHKCASDIHCCEPEWWNKWLMWWWRAKSATIRQVGDTNRIVGGMVVRDHAAHEMPWQPPWSRHVVVDAANVESQELCMATMKLDRNLGFRIQNLLSDLWSEVWFCNFGCTNPLPELNPLDSHPATSLGHFPVQINFQILGTCGPFIVLSQLVFLSGVYVQRLKQIVPRQTDIDQEAIMSRFHQKQLDMEKAAFREHFEEQERCQRQLQEQRLKLMREFKQQQLRNSETLARLQSVTHRHNYRCRHSRRLLLSLLGCVECMRRRLFWLMILSSGVFVSWDRGLLIPQVEREGFR